MRSFTLRDIFWLILVVGLLLGWRLDHSTQEQRVDTQTGRATRWYYAAGALQRFFEDDLHAEWNLSKRTVDVTGRVGGTGRTFSATIIGNSPSISIDALDGIELGEHATSISAQ